MTERTTSSRWVQSIVQALTLAGLDCPRLFHELHLDYDALDDPEARFPQDGITRLWHRAVELTGDPAIGLRMAQVIRPAAMHVVGYALMSSGTLHEGFARLLRYQRIIAEGAELGMIETGEGCVLSLRIHGDALPPARQAAEGALASLLAFCRWLTDTPIVPRQVRLQSAAPADLAPYRDLFAAPLCFGAEQDALVFGNADLDRPLPSANEALALVHDRFAGDYLARFASDRLSHETRQILCRLLPQGEPKKEAVARMLNLSARTFQRRLQEEGTSFQVLLDETRRTLARQYLAQPELRLLEIAYLLGFSDPSNFFRAFKRWFGTTPKAFRAGD